MLSTSERQLSNVRPLFWSIYYIWDEAEDILFIRFFAQFLPFALLTRVQGWGGRICLAQNTSNLSDVWQFFGEKMLRLIEYPGEGVYGEQHPSWDEVTDCNDGGCANMNSTTKTQKKPASINNHEERNMNRKENWNIKQVHCRGRSPLDRETSLDNSCHTRVKYSSHRW